MINTIISMRGALERPEFFGSQLAGETWANWRVLLIAIAGEELTAEELVIFQRLTNRQTAPVKAPAEFHGVIGRRGGKSRAMAVLASWLAGCKDHRAILAPHERALLPVLASTKEQAQNCFNFITGAIAASPLLRRLVEGQTSDTLMLASGVDFVVRPASFRSSHGSTMIGVIADETAWWRSDNSANPDVEILRALRPGLLTTKGPLIAISSPYSRRGELWKAYSKHFGREGSRILVAQASSQTTHPDLDPAFIAEQYEEDPIAARAEYGAEFRSDLDAFISEEIVAAAVVRGRHELPPEPKTKYYGFVDASGSGSDSFTLGISHAEGNIAVLDCVREVKPPFSPQSVVAEFAGVLKSYGIFEVTGDNYSGEIIREMFRAAGAYKVTKKSKSEIYVDLLPMLNSRRIALLDLPKLVAQLVGLERSTGRGGGRDVIDHAIHSHDDLINAAAGSLTLAALQPAKMSFPSIPIGPGRQAYTAEHTASLFDDRASGLPGIVAPAVYGDCSMPPGGWPAGSGPSASVTGGGFGHLDWTHTGGHRKH